MLALGSITAVLLSTLVALAVLRPGLRRLAVRNALRRRNDTLLVVLGCAFGTAIIVSSLLVGDTLDSSLRARATERLGPVDVVVSTYAVPVADAARDFLVADPPEAADGVLAAVAADATLAAPEKGSGEEIVPSARLIEVDFDWAREFDAGPESTGLVGQTPGPGEVVLGEDAAGALGVGPGDSVEAYAYGQFRLLQVSRVLPREGIAGYASEFEPESLNAFVELGTISDMIAGAGVSDNSQPPEQLLFVSAKGGVFSGADRTSELVRQIDSRLQVLPGYDIQPVKRDLLRGAAEDGAEFGELFLSLGAFAILAGVALLVNVLVMLSEERRRELGILRSLGMNRRSLAGAFVLEGALYAVVASALGMVLGIGVARLIVLLAGSVFSSARRGGVDLRLGIDPASLLLGFLTGLLVSLAVVAAASVWIGRMTVIEAIRDTARRENRKRGPWLWGAAAIGAGASMVASTIAIATGNDLGGLAFPPLMLVCLATVATGFFEARSSDPRFMRRAVVGAIAAGVMLWVVLAFPLLDLDVDNTALFVVQGLMLTLAAIVLIGQYQARVGSLLQRLAGGAGPVLKLALSYPSDRRFRTGTTLLAYSLIVFTLVFSSVLSGVFSSQQEALADDEGGGYDVLVSTSSADPVNPEELTSVDGVEDAATLNWTVAGFRVGGSGGFQDWALSGFGQEFPGDGAPALEEFDRDEYPDEAAVWKAVSENPNLAIADVAFLESGGGPPEDNVAVGNNIQIKTPAEDETASREVVAISAAGAAFSGVMVSKDSFAEIIETPVGNRHYLSVTENAKPEAVAARLQGKFLENGLEARSFEEVVQQALRSQEQFFNLIEGYLALGLLVGIAGLGVIMVRAVRERRRQIGVLRALGLPPAAVRSAFLVESGLVALEGTLLGAVLALATSYQLVAVSTAFGDTGASFTVPWAQLALLLTGVLAASLATTLPAASRAAAIPPSATLRATEEGGA